MREVLVRSGRNRPDLTPVYAHFEQATGIRVVVEKVYHRDVGARTLEEAGRPHADVLLTNSRIAIEELRGHGVFEPVRTAVAEALDADLRAEDFGWVAFTAWPRTAMVNLDVLPDPARWPRRLEDLATPAFAGRVGCASMVETTTVAQFASLVVARGEAWVRALLERLVAHGLRVYRSNLDTREALAREPLAVALANASNVHVFRAAGHRVADAWLDQAEGEVGTCVEAHTVAVLRGAAHPEPARAFVEFLLARETQEELARRYGETPVHPDARCDGVRPLAEIRRTAAPLAAVRAALATTEALLRRAGFDVG